MGTDYYLSCKKCREAKEKLYELELYDTAELIESDFDLEPVSRDLLPYANLKNFIDKHKDHGGLFLYFSI